MSSSAPRNRKERRAAAKDGRSADSIPMSQPDRTKPKGKTLFDLAAEREAVLNGRRQAARPQNGNSANEEPSVVTLNPDGTISGPDGEPLPAGMTAKIKESMKEGQTSPAPVDANGEETAAAEDAPLAEALLYTSTLLMLYFTLTVLVMNQYGLSQKIPWGQVTWQTASNAPLLFFIIYVLHPRAASWWAQGLFLATSVGCGVWMVRAAHEFGYMEVMRKAPGAGTLWVLAVLESRVELACLGLLVVGGYLWHGGYSLLA